MDARSADRTRVSMPLLLVGLALVVFAALGASHFLYRAALAKFPLLVLGSGRNWLFILLHAGVGAAGLTLLGLSRRRP
ncbi:MAG: hypothetical protein PHU25_02445 [Deltaproteobacteria bacterium]|nr:hypothetical protein [Deltaproteobacteria bacterium]